MIKNLGQVAGIYIGNVAPSNTTIIWCNPTILPYSFKVWGGTSWVDLATQEWVKITIGGYLISLPAKTIANDNDYLIINDGTNDNKIKVVDFVRSAVGNPLDFKGVIRVAADFPAPATLEGGDMYIIITSPSGGTVTDPYSGKTFEDTEKIVWDSVTNSWESLGLIKIEVNLGVDTKEDSVIITNTAGSSATIPTASASKAGVMSSQQLRWLINLINGTTVLANPDPSNPNIPAHKHNYSDLVNYPAIYQTLGQSTEGVMSQKAVTDTFAQYLPLSAGATKPLTERLYFSTTNLLCASDKNVILYSEPVAADTPGRTVIGNYYNRFNILTIGTDVLHNRAIEGDPAHGTPYKMWDEYNLPNPAKISDLAAYLLLSGGIMTGGVTFNNNIGLSWKNTAGSVLQQAYFNNNNVFVIGNTSNSQLVLRTGNTDVLRDRNGDSYKIWDSYNLPNPVGSTDLDGYLPLTAGATKQLTGALFISSPSNYLLYNKDNLPVISYNPNSDKVVDRYILLGNDSNRLFLYSSANTDILHYTSSAPGQTVSSYKMWDARNLPNPALQNGTYSGLTAGKVKGTITFTDGSTTLGTYNGSTDLTVNIGGGGPSGDYLPLTAGATKPLTGQLFANQGVNLPFNVALRATNEDGDIKAVVYSMPNNRLVLSDASYDTVISSTASDLIHSRTGTAYKIWDEYNLSSPATTTDLNSYIPRSAQGVTTSLLNLQGGIYRGGASMDGEFGYACNMLLRFDSGGTNWYTGGILSISTGGELRVAGVLNGALSVWRNMAVQGMANNFLYNGNEITFISQTEALSGVWLNYRGCSGGIGDYYLGSGKADNSLGGLIAGRIKAMDGLYLPNAKVLKTVSSTGGDRNLAYMAASDIIIFGDNNNMMRLRSEDSAIQHSRWRNNEEHLCTIWDSDMLPNPITGSGGVAGQLAKWSADTALSGGIAYSSGNTASTVVARDGNGAFSATTVTTTNANITNLNPGGENCIVQSGLIPRATGTCFLGSASRIFQNIYGNNIYTGVALLPVTTATAAIGTADLTYKSGYIQTIHTGGVLPLTTASSVGSSANPFSSVFATTFNGSATKWNGLSQQVVSSLPSTLTPNTMYFVTA